jgi:hypothetical protein
MEHTLRQVKTVPPQAAAAQVRCIPPVFHDAETHFLRADRFRA